MKPNDLKFLLSLNVGDKVIYKYGHARYGIKYTKEKIKRIMKCEDSVKVMFENASDLINCSPDFPNLLPYTEENILKADDCRFQKYLDNNIDILRKAKTKEKMTEIYNFIEGLK